MGLFDRISRVVRANLNDVVSKAEDPEKVLEQSVIDMQEDLIQLRQAVAKSIATQKRTEQQYNKNQTEANNWQQRAQLALSKGDENLAREALQRKKSFAETASMLGQQVQQQKGQTDTLKRNLIALESKISEAKTKKDMFKARAQAAKAQEQLQGAMNNVGTSSAMAAFERMEDKVLEMEARSQAAGELAGSGLDEQFRQLEAGSDIDDELASMKAQLSGSSEPSGALPGTAEEGKIPETETERQVTEAEIVDKDLEDLRKQLEM